MMTQRPVHALVTLPLSLALFGCGGGADTSKPDGAVEAALEAVKGADLATLVQVAMTPAQLREAAEQWDATRHEPASTADDLAFATTMGKLTAKGAEEQVFKELEPKLEEAQQQFKQMSGLFMMVTGLAAASDDQSAEEKQRAHDALSSVSSWLMELDLTDKEKVRKAIGIACATARKLDLKTSKDVKNLEFNQALDKGSVLLAGVKDVLAIYDLDVDAVLRSVEVGEPTIDGTSAKVPVSFTIFGDEHQLTPTLQHVDGAWYFSTE